MKIILITLLTIALISCNVSDSSVAMDNTSNDIVNTHNVVNTQEHKSNPNSESDKNTSDGSNKSKALTDSQKNILQLIKVIDLLWILKILLLRIHM
jgi:hypothetical protein